MLITPHAVAGASIAVLFPNPVVSLPLAVASHFVLDVIPHWQEVITSDYKLTKATFFRVPVDLLLTVGLVWKIAQMHSDQFYLIWLSAAVGNAPDLDVILTNIKPKILQINLFRRYYGWHCRIQKETKSFVGVLTQLVIILSCFWLVRQKNF